MSLMGPPGATATDANSHLKICTSFFITIDRLINLDQLTFDIFLNLRSIMIIVFVPTDFGNRRQIFCY